MNQNFFLNIVVSYIKIVMQLFIILGFKINPVSYTLDILVVKLILSYDRPFTLSINESGVYNAWELTMFRSKVVMLIIFSFTLWLDLVSVCWYWW